MYYITNIRSNCYTFAIGYSGYFNKCYRHTALQLHKKANHRPLMYHYPRSRFISSSSLLITKNKSLERKIEPLIVCNHKLLSSSKSNDLFNIEDMTSRSESTFNHKLYGVLKESKLDRYKYELVFGSLDYRLSNNYPTPLLDFKSSSNLYFLRSYHTSLSLNTLPLKKAGTSTEKDHNFTILSSPVSGNPSNANKTSPQKPIIIQHFEPNPLKEQSQDLETMPLDLLKEEFSNSSPDASSSKSAQSKETPKSSGPSIADNKRKSNKNLEVSVNEKKKSLGRRVINEVKHYYHGFRLLFIDIGIAARLLWQLAKGGSLTRREQNQLVTTSADVFRLVPFLVFVIIPFMEFLLPVALKLFPGMLPSTFKSENTEQEKLRRNLKLKLEMAKFLQNTLEQVSSEKVAVGSLKATEFVQFVEKIRKSGEPTSNTEIMKYSKLFQDELTLENLSHPQLVALCKILELNTIGTNNFLRFQLRLRLRQLHYDDKMIIKEGLNELNTWELQEACRARGMRSLGLTEARLKLQLQQWLDLHVNSKVPASLLLLSRTFYLHDINQTPADRIRATISSLPEATMEIAKEKISEIDSEPVDNKKKREIIKKEQVAIKLEKEQARKLEEERKLEEAKLQERADVNLEQNILFKKEILVDNAVELKGADKETGYDIMDSDISDNDLRELKETFSKRMSTFASMNVQDLQVMLSSGKTGKDAAESKAAKRLEDRITKMIKKLDSMENQLKGSKQDEDETDKEMNINLEMIDEISKKKRNLIGINELMNGIKRLQKLPDGSGSRLKDIVEVLDADHDGKVDINSALKAILLSERKMDAVIELLGRENIQISHDQLAAIIDLLHSDVVKEEKKDEVLEEIIEKNDKGL